PDGGPRRARALQGARPALAIRRSRREEAARRGGLPQRLRVHARLPEQPLCERREDLPGAGRHVGARRPRREAQRHAVRDFHPQDPEARHERLHARLGRRDLRRALYAAVAGAHADHGRGRPAGSALHEGGLILRLAWLRLREHDLAWSFRRSPVAVAAALVTLACVGAALAAPWIAPQDPFNPAGLDLNQAFRPPAWLDGGAARYFLGSD